MNLAIIVTHFNFCNYRAPVVNLARFSEAIGQTFQLYHAGYMDGPISPESIVMMATEKNVMWQKEAMINYAIRRLPDNYDAVAWIDADLLFESKCWYEDTLAALEDHAVVQMFSHIRYLGPNGESTRWRGGSAFVGQKDVFTAPGGAIAARREIMDKCPLYDRHILGSGDQIFMNAAQLHRERDIKGLSNKLRQSISEYSARARNVIGGSVGCIPGNVQHMWHGDVGQRWYRDRYEILASWGYDPDEDVRVGENGLLEWCDGNDNLVLRGLVKEYFEQRKEDTPRGSGVEAGGL